MVKRVGLAVLKAGALGMALVVAPLLTFSESTLRSLIDRWLTQCVMVVQVDGASGESPLVQLHMFGDMPETLPITFSSKTSPIERVSFLNHVEQQSSDDKTNLLVHQLASERCPGALCPQTFDPSEKLTLRLPTLSSQYLYQFRVVFVGTGAARDLRVYVQPRSSDKVACRVEAAGPSNYFARQSRGMQVGLLFLAFVVLTLLLGIFRNWKGDA